MMICQSTGKELGKVMLVRAVIILLWTTVCVQAIVWRSDVVEIEAEQKGEMKQVGKVMYSPLRVFGGSCVAMGGKWVLTCRHGTEKWSAGNLRVSFPALGKESYAVKSVTLCGSSDLALLELKKEVKGAKEMKLYEGDEEVGKRVWIGGYGLCGPVDKIGLAGVFHSGHNRVDALRKGKLSISLGRPEDATTEKDEALLALLDSGSPLFVETEEGWKLAGIASTASNGRTPNYGDQGNYARVSRELQWLRKVRGN